MRKIKYERANADKGGKCLTPCPYGQKFLGRLINVGSDACRNCTYFVSIDRNSYVVDCNHVEAEEMDKLFNGVYMIEPKNIDKVMLPDVALKILKTCEMDLSIDHGLSKGQVLKRKAYDYLYNLFPEKEEETGDGK